MSTARWYCLSREGYATLCFDYEDARTTAAENDAIFPKQVPHRAVQLVEVSGAAAPVGLPAGEQTGPVAAAPTLRALSSEQMEAAYRKAMTGKGFGS